MSKGSSQIKRKPTNLNLKKLEEIEVAKQLSDQKYSLFQTRCYNALKKLVLILVFLFLLALCVGLIALLLCYIFHNNTIIQFLFNAVQCLVAVISLVIGFWGWICTLQSERRNEKAGLHIDAFSAMRNPCPFVLEDDVKKQTY